MPSPNSNTIILSWRDIRDILLFLPIVHLSFCFIFLLFYSLSFGRGVEQFYEPSDIFHVSFRDIAPGYLTLAIVAPFGFYLGGRLRKQRSEAKRAGEESLSRHHRKTFFRVSFVNYMMVFIAILYAVAYFMLTGEISVSSIVIIALAVVLLALFVKHFKDTDRIEPILGMLIIYPLLSSAFSGAQAGEMDRMHSYDDLAKSHPVCGDFTIVRRVGDHYMAVSKKGARAMLDKECKARFILPMVTVH